MRRQRLPLLLSQCGGRKIGSSFITAIFPDGFFSWTLTPRPIAIFWKALGGCGSLFKVQIPESFKYSLLERSLNSVYIVQDCCYKACKQYDVNETMERQFLFPADLDARDLVAAVIHEQSARYMSFLTNFAAGFQDTQLNMYRWLLYPVVTADVKELEAGLSYRTIRNSIQSKHPEGTALNPGNITQA